MERCPSCATWELKIIAAILERPVIEKILTHLGLDPPAAGRIAEGDVVVFTAATGRLYVKRIAGMPGYTVTLGAGRLYVNGRAWDGGPRKPGAHVERWRVPDGHCVVVGDNLQESDDSRVWHEPFVAQACIGGVGFRRWPWRRLAPDSNDHSRQAPASLGLPYTNARSSRSAVRSSAR